jgi:transcriptional antiterminator RfaH
MPILDLETSIHPPDLLERSVACEEGRRWWVLHTRPRQEKALARRLLGLQIPFYLPLVAREHLIRRRRVRSHIPLFGGYVFLFASDEERTECLTTGRAASALVVGDGQQLARELRAVRQLIAADAPLTPERRLAPGRRVRVKEGALAGIEGTILARRGRRRFVVAVQFLQQGVSMEVENLLLEALD